MKALRLQGLNLRIRSFELEAWKGLEFRGLPWTPNNLPFQGLHKETIVRSPKKRRFPGVQRGSTAGFWVPRVAVGGFHELETLLDQSCY